MDDYETLNKIGDGTFGTVYKCRKRKRQITDNAHKNKSVIGDHVNHDEDQGLVAIKKMKKKYYNWEDCINSREIKVLKKLNHRNIVLLKEVIRTDNSLYLIFEHMEENLHQLIHNRSLPFPEATIRSIVFQITDGLGYIHKHGFFHRDIKPENILCRNGPACIKIGDFGLTREIDSEPPFTEYVSTRWYRAPELLLHSTNYGPSVDLWALGCVTGELYILGPVFPGRSEIDQIFKICQTLGTPPKNSWPEGQRLASIEQFKFPNIIQLELTSLITNCSDDGISLIRTLLKWNPNERPTIKEILNHRFFKHS